MLLRRRLACETAYSLPWAPSLVASACSSGGGGVSAARGSGPGHGSARHGSPGLGGARQSAAASAGTASSTAPSPASSRAPGDGHRAVRRRGRRQVQRDHEGLRGQDGHRRSQYDRLQGVRGDDLTARRRRQRARHRRLPAARPAGELRQGRQGHRPDAKSSTRPPCRRNYNQSWLDMAHDGRRRAATSWPASGSGSTARASSGIPRRPSTPPATRSRPPGTS